VADAKLIQSLKAAVAASPADATLRLHLAELLLEAGENEEALQHLAHVLKDEPANKDARRLTAEALLGRPVPGKSAESAKTEPEPPGEPAEDSFDWDSAEESFEGELEPMFIESDLEEASADAWDVERESITLADVGGLADVKKRLEVAFLAPLRNPELRKLYGKQLRGGLLLYGPPGCGKSYVARALAGELGAGFIVVSIHEILDMWVGRSERNLHELFNLARRNAPCVLFIDELDALGRRRSQLHTSAMRTTVNQLLAELDGMESANEGVFVLGATNHPWDIDSALRRPGRFDRMILVLPPDEAAREVIFKAHLQERPIAGVDLKRLARSSDGLTGADIAHVCESAAELAMIDAVASGEVRMIEMRDLETALVEVRPSAGEWFETARNVVSFANASGDYDDLLAFMKKRKML